MVLHVEMLSRSDWGSIHIVYEKQKDDDVMSCLDSMQMNEVHENLSQARIQYFQIHVITHTHTYRVADKVGMIMVMIIIMVVITVSSTMLKINLS